MIVSQLSVMFTATWIGSLECSDSCRIILSESLCFLGQGAYKFAFEIKVLLDERQARGIDIIKLYTGITPWEARHIMVEAKKRNMRGIADFWCTNLSRTVFEVSLIDSYAHGGCREITREEAEWMRDNGKFAMVTLSVFETMGGQRAFAEGDRDLRFETGEGPGAVRVEAVSGVLHRREGLGSPRDVEEANGHAAGLGVVDLEVRCFLRCDDGCECGQCDRGEPK